MNSKEVNFECEDPENCDEYHNENTIDWEFPHHYGCDCDDCMMWYYIGLKG